MPDAKLKYQQLLSYGKKLPPMPQEDHTDENKVRGCVSQVWSLPLQRRVANPEEINVTCSKAKSAALCFSVCEYCAPATIISDTAHASVGLGEASSQRREDLLAC